jgi:hypothetical protein
MPEWLLLCGWDASTLPCRPVRLCSATRCAGLQRGACRIFLTVPTFPFESCPFCLCGWLRKDSCDCVCYVFHCTQPCTAGFFCPEGSLSAQERACGGSASNPLAAAVLCPTGSSNATAVSAGWYSTGSAPEAPHQRSGQAMCPVGSYCIDGVRVRAQRSTVLGSPVLLCLVFPTVKGGGCSFVCSLLWAHCK